MDINDLPKQGPMLLLADDTTIMSEGTTTQEAEMNTEVTLFLAKEWLILNTLQINQNKIGFSLIPHLLSQGNNEGVANQLAIIQVAGIF